MSEEVSPPKEYRCPGCDREIYSRRRKKCEFCELPLPPEFLLTDEELAAMDQEIREIHERRERDKAQEEEERKGDAHSAAVVPIFFIPP